MKKIVRLTESDLNRIVKRVIKEDEACGFYDTIWEAGDTWRYLSSSNKAQWKHIESKNPSKKISDVLEEFQKLGVDWNIDTAEEADLVDSEMTEQQLDAALDFMEWAERKNIANSRIPKNKSCIKGYTPKR